MMMIKFNLKYSVKVSFGCYKLLFIAYMLCV